MKILKGTKGTIRSRRLPRAKPWAQGREAAREGIPLPGIVGALLLALPGFAPHASASGPEEILTRSGARYLEVAILEADRHGLLFRHARGIAKLPYDELPERFRPRGDESAAASGGDGGGQREAEAISAPDANDANEGAGDGDGFPGLHGRTPAEEGDPGAAWGAGAGTHHPVSVVARARVRWIQARPVSAPPCPSLLLWGAPCVHPGMARPLWRWSPGFPDAPHWRSHWPRRPLPPHADFHPSPANRAAALAELLLACPTL